jgi:MATE family multidrug resistance protein
MTGGMKLDLTGPGPRISGHRPSSIFKGAWILEARELLRLALPLAATQLAQMIILATDTAMLGHFSKDALAAAALGNTIFFFAWLVGSGPAQAVSPIIAHIRGFHAAAAKPRDRREVRAVTRMGLWSAALVSVPLFGVLLCTRPLLLFFHQEPQLAAEAAVYMSSLQYGLPFALGFQVLRSFATALNRPVPPLLVMLLAIAFNALGDYALIFGHFGLPRLGVFGAGLASACSNLFSFAAMLAIALAAPGLRPYRLLRRLGQPDWSKLAELFRLGIPMGITMVFEVTLFNAATLVMGVFGLASLAAHQVAITIPSLTFMVPLGVGLAAGVRVGLAAGAGDAVAARRAGFTAIGIGALFMSATSLLLLFFARAIASLWLPDVPANAAVLALAVTFLHVGAAFQLADGFQVTAGFALRGLKDARAPMWIAGASYWLAGAPMCVFLGFGLGMKGFGIWLGLAFGLLVAAILLTARFAFLSRRP